MGEGVTRITAKPTTPLPENAVRARVITYVWSETQPLAGPDLGIFRTAGTLNRLMTWGAKHGRDKVTDTPTKQFVWVGVEDGADVFEEVL